LPAHGNKAAAGFALHPLRAGDEAPKIALAAAPGASPATRRLAEVLVEFCSARDPRAVA